MVGRGHQYARGVGQGICQRPGAKEWEVQEIIVQDRVEKRGQGWSVSQRGRQGLECGSVLKHWPSMRRMEILIKQW